MTCDSVSSFKFKCRTHPWGPSPFSLLLCLCLSPLSSLLFLLHSFSPFHLISSCSQFAFSISKCFEANASLKIPLPPPETELRDCLPSFLLSIFLFTVSSIFHPCLSAPPLPGPAFLTPFLLLLAVLFLLEKLVSGQGEVNLLWPTIPCRVSPSLSLFDSFS